MKKVKLIFGVGLSMVLSNYLVAANNNFINVVKSIKEKVNKYNKYDLQDVRFKKLTPGITYVKTNQATDRIILKVDSTFNEQNLKLVSNKIGINIDKIRSFKIFNSKVGIKSNTKIIVVKISDTNKIDEAINNLQQIPGVIKAQKDEIIKAFRVPNDTNYSNQWDMQKIDAEKAWDASTGSQDVLVGVIDTGVDYYHPDLRDNIWVNEAELNGEPGKDDDGDGYVDDIHGIDVVNGDSDPMDDNGHGTHVSGTIAAEGNNNIGIAGINWNTKIIACKFLNSQGAGYLSGAIECVNYMNTLKGMGYNLVAVNNSWGGGGYSDDLYNAFSSANDLGIIHVCAAGNENNDNDSNPSYPASYDLPNIISVASTNNNDELSWFSNYGTESVDLAAPGEDILSTLPSYIECLPQKVLYGIGFEKNTSISGWSFLTIDPRLPIRDIPSLHWQRSDEEGYDSNWSLSDSPNENYVDNTFQSAITKSFDLSDYNNTDENQCVGLQYRINGKTENYFDKLYVLLSGDNWESYSIYDIQTGEKNWSVGGRNVINADLLTNNFKIAFLRTNDCCVNYQGYDIDNLLIYQGIPRRIGRYGVLSGTSMATPHVTGAIALAASLYPDENMTQRIDRIMNGVDYIPDLDGKVKTAGRLNLAKVLNGENVIKGFDNNVTVNNEWKDITITLNYDSNQTPVIIAGPISYHGGQGCVVRLKDINSTNANIRVEEWNYLDGQHTNENVSLLGLKPGRYLLADGKVVIEVGSFEISGTTDWFNIEFTQPFTSKPYLFLTVDTFNGPDTVVVRARNVTTSGFPARLFEQQSLMGSAHAKEKIGYVAIYSEDNNFTLFKNTDHEINVSLATVEVNSDWTDTPFGVQLKLQEDQSEDDETAHTKEDIDVMKFGDKIFAQDVSTKGLDPITIRYRNK